MGCCAFGEDLGGDELRVAGGVLCRELGCDGVDGRLGVRWPDPLGRFEPPPEVSPLRSEPRSPKLAVAMNGGARSAPTSAIVGRVRAAAEPEAKRDERPDTA